MMKKIISIYGLLLFAIAVLSSFGNAPQSDVKLTNAVDTLQSDIKLPPDGNSSQSKDQLPNYNSSPQAVGKEMAEIQCEKRDLFLKALTDSTAKKQYIKLDERAEALFKYVGENYSAKQKLEYSDALDKAGEACLQK